MHIFKLMLIIVPSIFLPRQRLILENVEPAKLEPWRRASTPPASLWISKAFFRKLSLECFFIHMGSK